jgi:hypothetical protein
MAGDIRLLLPLRTTRILAAMQKQMRVACFAASPDDQQRLALRKTICCSAASCEEDGMLEKIALVTGGGTGVGKAIALALS